MSALFPIPTGLRPSAQGCRGPRPDWPSEATLGNVVHCFPQPQRGCINHAHANGLNPFRVVFDFDDSPRVGRPSQPWAECRYPVGVRITEASHE
jgi:hypothetical protein